MVINNVVVLHSWHDSGKPSHTLLSLPVLTKATMSRNKTAPQWQPLPHECGDEKTQGTHALAAHT
jgi:hypothetical protein